MLTFFRTPNQVANLMFEREILGGIFYDEKQQGVHQDTERLQCRYCLRKFGRTDALTRHMRTCPSKKAKEQASTFTEFKIPDNKEEHLELSFPLAKGERLVMFVVGRNGCGKSTFIQKLLTNYLKVYKNRKILLFSTQEYDDKLDKVFKDKINRVDLGEEFINSPFSLDEIRNTICIFDDVDSIRDKKLKEALFKLRDDILKNGRSHTGDRNEDIDIIITNHDVLGGHDTATMIRESFFYVVFPKGSTSHAINTICKKYAGLKNDHIKRIINNPARCVVIHNTHPGFVLTEKEIFLT